MNLEYRETAPFTRDFKKLTKRFRTLPEDLENAKRFAIELYHLHNIDNQSIFQIQEFQTDDVLIFKLIKFACKALKGKGVRSGLRVIYAYHTDQLRVDFLEMYYKGGRENEDRGRICSYLEHLSYNY